MLSCGNQLLQELVVGSIQFFLTLTFNLGIFSQSISCISKCHFQLHSALTGLTAVRFVHNDRERFSSGIAHQIVDNRELLKGCDDDTLTVLHSFQQIFGTLLFVDQNDAAQCVVKAVDGILQLRIQHLSVCYNDDGSKYCFVLGIVQACQTIGRPRNAVGLTGASAVLYEIIMTGAVFLGMFNQLADNIQLMITREDNLLGHIGADLAVGQRDLLDFLLIADELLQNIKEAVLLQNSFPQISSHIAAVGILRVSGATINAWAIAALVERQEVSLVSEQAGSHGNPIQVSGKIG